MPLWTTSKNEKGGTEKCTSYESAIYLHGIDLLFQEQRTGLRLEWYFSL